MVMFKVLLLSHCLFTNHVLRTIFERQLVMGEEPVEGPIIVKGRLRKGVKKTRRQTLSDGVTYFFGWIRTPRVTLRHELEFWTRDRGEYSANEPLLRLQAEKKSMSTPTKVVVSLGSGIALILGIKMLINWLMGGNRHNQDPNTQHLVPLFQAWPPSTLRTMKPETLKALLNDRRAMMINVETLLMALDLNHHCHLLNRLTLGELLAMTRQDVEANRITEAELRMIMEGAEYLQGLSFEKFLIE